MRKIILVFIAVSTLVLVAFSKKPAKLKNKADGEFITISGKVTNVKPQSFSLKVDDKNILVEMDDWDWDADGYKLVNGDRVVVTGRVDKDFLEKSKIEAGSVYVKNLNTYFYASSLDEEGAPYLSTSYVYNNTLNDGSHVDVFGRVTSIDGRDMMVDTGVRKLKVDTSTLIYNPMDNIGYTKIEEGDYVRVGGVVDVGYFNSKEIEASYLNEI